VDNNKLNNELVNEEVASNEEVALDDKNNSEENLLIDKSALDKTIKEGQKLIDNSFSSKEGDNSKELKEENINKSMDFNLSDTDDPNLKWYIVYARSGYEQKAKFALETRIKTYNMEAFIKDILIPSEEVVELTKGKKKTSTRKFYPGYILVRMIMNEDTWHFVKTTPKIVGFIGGSTNPPSVKNEEVLKISNQIKDNTIKPVLKVNFEEGETIRVKEGPFTNFTGIVEEVKPEKNKLRVLVSIFGRSTPVELEFTQVEKI